MRDLLVEGPFVLIVAIHRPFGLIVTLPRLTLSRPRHPSLKICLPCFNPYRGYDMTNRSKPRRGREVASEDADDVRRRRAAEDT